MALKTCLLFLATILSVHLYSQEIPEVIEEAEYRAGQKKIAAARVGIAADSTGKKGVISGDGAVVLQFEYDSIRSISSAQEGFMVQKGKKWGLTDAHGAIVLPISYERLEFVKEGGGYVFIAQSGRKCGLLAWPDRILIGFEYDALSFPPGDHFMYKANGILARKGEKWGIINQKNETLVPFEYDEITFSRFNHGMIVSQNGKKKALKNNGLQALPISFVEVRPYLEYLTIRDSTGRWGVCTYDKIVAPCLFEYDQIHYNLSGVVNIKTPEANMLFTGFGHFEPAQYQSVEKFTHNSEIYHMSDGRKCIVGLAITLDSLHPPIEYFHKMEKNGEYLILTDEKGRQGLRLYMDAICLAPVIFDSLEVNTTKDQKADFDRRPEKRQRETLAATGRKSVDGNLYYIGNFGSIIVMK